MKTPKKVRELTLQCSCVGISRYEWDALMQGAKRADKRQINRLVKEHLPELYNDLALNFYNPYNYYKTQTHLILVHSHIEYFIRYN